LSQTVSAADSALSDIHMDPGPDRTSCEEDFADGFHDESAGNIITGQEWVGSQCEQMDNRPSI